MKKMTTTIYRIQDAEGRGPWKPGFSHRWVQYREDLHNLVPWFLEFDESMILALVIHSRGCAFGSGCRTKEQLRRWFTEREYSTLLEFGYRSVKMGANLILAESEIQLVFMRSSSLERDVEPFNLY